MAQLRVASLSIAPHRPEHQQAPKGQSTTMAKGIFPRMDTGEIIAALEGWGFPVTQQQLAHPNSDFVESVYFACLQQVTELNQETLRQPVQEVLDAAQTDDRVSEW